jgi:hypothetical protein
MLNLKGIIYLFSGFAALIGISYFVYNHGDIKEHCNCIPKANYFDTVDVSQFKIVVNENNSADFITTLDNLKQNVGPAYIRDGVLRCSGLMYKKYDKDTTKYILAVLETVGKTDRAEIIDKSNDLEYDFEFKITKAFKYFKKSTECMDCSFSNSTRGHRTGFQHCSYTVICKNGDISKATFKFKDYYLSSISFE